MSDCQAELLTSSDPDRSRWWCPKCGPNISGRCDLPYHDEPERTHWEGCYRSPKHHNCAVEEVDRLRAQLATAREGLETTANALLRVTDCFDDAATASDWNSETFESAKLVVTNARAIEASARRTLAALDGTDTGGEDG